MDYEGQARKEANQLTDLEILDFLDQLEKIPSHRSPINGKQARLCFEFMEDTGCRVNETIHVKKQDIDFGTRILTVTQPKTEERCKCSKWIYKDLYSRQKVLKYADPKCSKCHGKGKYKQPQITTITPRLIGKLKEYCKGMKDYEFLFHVSRQSLWKWGDVAGQNAHLRIFQRKKEREIDGIFLHLFRALCSKRMIRDFKEYDYKDQLVAKKLRHSFRFVTDRYTAIDIHYLLKCEDEVYDFLK